MKKLWLILIIAIVAFVAIHSVKALPACNCEFNFDCADWDIGEQCCNTCNCGFSCGAPTPYCGDATCNGAETCSSCPQDCGACGCTYPYVSCSGSCVLLGSDNYNCGSCGTVCTGGRWCSSGSCIECMRDDECDKRQHCSSGNCVADSCTPTTCSAIGASCGSYSDGCSGTLFCGSCNGDTYCDANSKTCELAPVTCDTCSSLGKECGSWSDNCGHTLNCGGCSSGYSCNSNGACSLSLGVCGDGRCDATESCSVCPMDCGACPCSYPYTNCGGSCVLLGSDSYNCGSCGHSCGSGTCTNGVCCTPAWTDWSACDCTGTKYSWDLNSCDSNNLFDTLPCTPPSSCSCTDTCSSLGYTCGTHTICGSSVNCGPCDSCGNVCAGGKTCVSGVCTCPSSKPTDCNGVCVNTQGNDVSHCGSCNACPDIYLDYCDTGVCYSAQCDHGSCNTASDCSGLYSTKCIGTGYEEAVRWTCEGRCCVENFASSTQCTGGQTCVGAYGGTCQCPSGQSWDGNNCVVPTCLLGKCDQGLGPVSECVSGGTAIENGVQYGCDANNCRTNRKVLGSTTSCDSVSDGCLDQTHVRYRNYYCDTPIACDSYTTSSVACTGGQVCQGGACVNPDPCQTSCSGCSTKPACDSSLANSPKGCDWINNACKDATSGCINVGQYDVNSGICCAYVGSKSTDWISLIVTTY